MICEDDGTNETSYLLLPTSYFVIEIVLKVFTTEHLPCI